MRLWQLICIGIGRQEAALAPRALIADSDLELRQRLYSRLLDADIFADCVATAGEALHKLEETGYSVVIADVGLPNNGIERVVEWIARMDRAKRPIVLVVAANAEAARSLDVEIVQIVLRRPVDIAQIVDLVGSCLRISTAPRRQRQAGDGGPQPEARS